MTERQDQAVWQVVEARDVYDNPWIRVVEHDVIDPNGNPGLYGVVRVKGLAVGILPVDGEGMTWLVGQHRFPRDYYSWELPEGGGSFDDPQGSAERELLEETGLKAGGWQEILRMDLSNSITDEQAIGFIAWDLEEGVAQPEACERLELRRMPVREAVEMALSGVIVDAIAQTMLLKADALARRGMLPAELARHII
ncbi:NUDIX hydrolase [uncultured Nisaea sp.]|uniref:NUDIX hydrolase n=1 Tax=uncultured Nisaea sp. TaxID=538215 RepID=UPI0030EE4BED|tara:strand:+ start:3057 stop:3644 length:588 start_codon:yes stop_codon:yes gene_type:complete